MLKAANVLRRDFPDASADASVRKNEGVLNKGGYLVLTDIHPFQIVTPRSVLESGHTLLGDCVHVLPKVEPETELETILSMMNENSTNTLLVYRDNDFLGVVQRKDVSQALCDINFRLGEAVRLKTKELKKSRDHFIQLADSIAAFFALNEELKITYWGDTAAKLSGIGQEAALGKKLDEVIPLGRVRERYEKLFRKVAGTKQSRRTTYTHNGELYNLTIYPFNKGVSVVARTRSEECPMQLRDAEIGENVIMQVSQTLHNDIGQYLSAISLRCAELAEKINRQIPVTPGDVNGIHDLCISANESLHELVESILWKAGEHIADSDLVNSLCKGIEKMYRLEIIRNYSGFRLPEDSLNRRHVVRFLQEALTNAAKHSGQKEIALAMQCEAGRLICRISDRGGGFDAMNVRKGTGMRLMQFNADELDGELEISSGEEGTTVVLKLPV